MKTIKKISIITCILLSNSLLAQTDWYVNKQNGSNSNNGTSSSTPYKTVEYAVNHGVDPGDTVYIMGEYHNDSYDPNFSFNTQEESANDDNDERIKGITDAHLWHGENTIRLTKVHGTPGTNGNPDLYITFKPYDNNTILKGDGANIFRVTKCSYIIIEGFEMEGEVDRIPLSTAFDCQFIYIKDDADINNLSLAPNNINNVENNPPTGNKVYYRVPPHWTVDQIKENNTSANSGGTYNGPGWQILNTSSTPKIIRPSYTSTRGLYVSNAHHIIIKNNSIHHLPGGGLRLSEVAYAEVVGNKIHNCSRRSYGGTHALVVTKAISDASDTINGGDQNGEDSSINSNDDTTNRIKIVKNKVYFNYNEVYSWAPTKDLIEPHLDEGKGISLQRNRTTDAPWAQGRILVENNICYWNGYSGVHTNDGDRIDFINNTCYMNSYTQSITYINNTTNSGGNIGISASDGTDIKMINNISVIDGDLQRFAMSSNQSNNITAIDNNLLWGTGNNLIEDTDISGSSALAEQLIENPNFACVPTKAQILAEINAGNEPYLLPFDFHLQENSNAIDSGASVLLTEDYYGTSRDDTPDRGAIESKLCNINNLTTWKIINNVAAWTNGEPDTTTPVVLETDYNTSLANLNCCSLEISSDVTLTIDEDEYLKVKNNITNNGTINVLNKGSLVMVNEGGIINGTGNYTIHKTTPPYVNYDYTYWSSPTQNETIGQALVNSPSNYIFGFNANDFLDIYNSGSPQSSGIPDTFDDDGNAWTNVASNQVMSPGVGYIAMGEGSPFPIDTNSNDTHTQSVIFTGKPNTDLIEVPVFKDKYHQDNINVTDGNLTNTNANLIGNPYPSAIDLNNFFVENNSILQGTFYFWTHDTPISNSNPGPNIYNFTNNDYATATSDGINFITTSSSSANKNAPKFLASGQSIFVNVLDNGMLKFTNDMRVTGNNDTFLRSSNSLNLIKLSLEGADNSYSQIAIAFKQKGNDNYTNGQDAQRLENGNEMDFFSIIEEDNRRFAIQTLGSFNTNKSISLGIEIINNQQTYKITLEDRQGIFNTGQNVYIKDLFTNTVHNLSNSAYVFNSEIGANIRDRFKLIFTNSTLNIEEENIESSIRIINNNNDLLTISSLNQIIKNIDIYNMLGQKLVSKQNNKNSIVINNIFKKGQIQIIKITLIDNTVVTKKILN